MLTIYYIEISLVLNKPFRRISRRNLSRASTRSFRTCRKTAGLSENALTILLRFKTCVGALFRPEGLDLRACFNDPPLYVDALNRWGFTLRPTYDRVEFQVKPLRVLPLQVFVRDVGPTAPADRKPSSLVVDVDLDVRVLASVVPRVSAAFNYSLHEYSYSHSQKVAWI